MNNENRNIDCCPRPEPAVWDNKILEWNNKKFIKDKVFTLFFIPINFGSVIMRMTKKAKIAGATALDWLCLSDHTSKWNMNLYLAVDKEVPDTENVTLSGKFLSKVYEGNFKEIGNWRKDFENYAKAKNLQLQKLYLWYTTCPKCAKKYGKNYLVIIGKVE